MMETIKARVMDGAEGKSVAEIEAAVIAAHEGTAEAEALKTKAEAELRAKAEAVAKETTGSPELTQESVMSFLNKEYSSDITDLGSLFKKSETPELPEDVAAYFNYKKETGRGLNDFVRLQSDFDSMEESALLTEYYQATEKGLDSSDISDLIEDKFGYDDDLDDEKDVKRKKLAIKRELAKAKVFLNDQKDKYKAPLESGKAGLSKDQEENLKAYSDYIEESKSLEGSNKQKYETFLKRTDEVFNDEFKGFEFKVGESSLVFKPSSAEELKKNQSDVATFIKKFTDKDGVITDAKGYHRALSVAMNPEKFAKFFYDQGASVAIDDSVKKAKNIKMDTRQAHQSFSSDGLKVRAVGDTSSGNRLVIKKR